MNVTCPNCATIYRVDPAKVPEAGVRARCAICSAVFPVRREGVPAAAATPVAAAPASVTPAAVAPAAAGAPLAEPVREAVAPAPAPVSSPEPPVTEARPEVARPAAPLPPRPISRPASAPASPAAPLPGSASAAPASPARPAGPPRPAAPPAFAGLARPAASPPPAPSAAAPAPAPMPATPTPTTPRLVNPFLSQDPTLKARRLARALISDMVVYHPTKRQEGLRDGTLKELFEEEIKKSWEEYTEQVGHQVAESTPFFREALNEILAGGKQVF